MTSQRKVINAKDVLGNVNNDVTHWRNCLHYFTSFPMFNELSFPHLPPLDPLSVIDTLECLRDHLGVAEG